nr:hypothetical protein [uncultured bacterium]
MIGRATDALASPSLLARTVGGGIAGVLLGGLACYAVYGLAPGFAATLDTPPAVARGFHPTEFEPGGLSFAWTRDRVTFAFDGLDRSRAWTLTLRAKAGRGPTLPPPVATIDVDGAVLTTTTVGSAWQEIRTVVPANPAASRARPTRVTLQVAPTFVPGPGDTRTLGVIVDEARLVPDGLPVAPRRAAVAAAAAAGLLGAAIAAIGVPLPWALGLVAFFALAQAAALAAGSAPYTRAYLERIPDVAAAAAVGLAVAAVAAAALRRPLSAAAAGALAVTGIALVLELEGLLHPGKAVVDALFHAHRLQWVAEGRYFFTQPMPSGVAFPYAIGLYVVALPWAQLTRDHVMLLRIVVLATHALAGLSLYPLAARAWQDRKIAVAAVAAYHLAPLPFVVIGNANQTYAFGQSVATIALASAMTWPLGWARPLAGRRWLAAAGVTALLALALLSHVGLIPLLGGLAGVSAVLLAWRGVGHDRQAGWILLAATAVAALLAVGLYYRHFGDAFRSAQRVGQSDAAGASAVEPAVVGEPGPAVASPPVEGSSRPARAVRAGGLAVAAFGAPLILLATVGLVRHGWRSARDRASLVVMASLIVGAVVLAVSVLAPVEPRFERYTDEFISRLYYASLPAVALLAAAGAVSLWNAGRPGQMASALLALPALALAASQWLGWMR